MPKRVCVIGGGWSGLAAAVRARQSGMAVTLCETARLWGGRARSWSGDGEADALDNGQHLLIGAYSQTLALMVEMGADLDVALARMPLALCGPDGIGLRLRPGPPLLSFARAVFGHRGWNWTDRVSLLREASRWARAGFTCAPDLTVDQLCLGITPRVRRELIAPLCAAALNTPGVDASARVFLRVVRDALFSGPGASDLLVPRQALDHLLPRPCVEWLAREGVVLRPGHRVRTLDRLADRWAVDDEDFDLVVLACSATEAGRLVLAIDPGWTQRACALDYEPIVTVYLRCAGARLPASLIALQDGPDDPAQFAFDHGALGGAEGRFAFVISAAAAWVERGIDETAAAVLSQTLRCFPAGVWPTPPVLEAVRAERRATFRCTPGLDRPPAWIAPGLVAAGDYIDGPYPATLEGAVRSGETAIRLLQSQTVAPVDDFIQSGP